MKELTVARERSKVEGIRAKPAPARRSFARGLVIALPLAALLWAGIFFLV